jgi:geranylgeranyl transferase type-2 subunit beta
VSLPYLEVPDALLAAALAGHSHTFRAAQIRALLAFQRPEGGFSGRQGPADPYYTDFALRVLLPAGAPVAELSRAAQYLASLPPAEDLAHAFSRLNSARMLAVAGHSVPAEATDPALALRQCALPGGGYRRSPDAGASAYATFIAVLCSAVADLPLPTPDDLGRALPPLQARSGGFREQPGPGQAQTSATAAVLGAHTLVPFLGDDAAARALAFLGSMQTPGGGFLAHPQAAVPDLLATFSALYALGVADALPLPCLLAAARFARSLALPAGGFLACPGDAGTDPEFTYYGLGVLSLARAAASSGAPT